MVVLNHARSFNLSGIRSFEYKFFGIWGPQASEQIFDSSPLLLSFSFLGFHRRILSNQNYSIFFTICVHLVFPRLVESYFGFSRLLRIFSISSKLNIVFCGDIHTYRTVSCAMAHFSVFITLSFVANKALKLLTA